MENSTKLKIAKKYESMLKLVETDYDGYWGYAQPGFMFENTGSHTAHGENQKDFMSDLRSLAPCDCTQCLKEGKNDS